MKDVGQVLRGHCADQLLITTALLLFCCATLLPACSDVGPAPVSDAHAALDSQGVVDACYGPIPRRKSLPRVTSDPDSIFDICWHYVSVKAGSYLGSTGSAGHTLRIDEDCATATLEVLHQGKLVRVQWRITGEH